MKLRPSDIPSLTGLRIASPLIALAVIGASAVGSWNEALSSAESYAEARLDLLEKHVAGITSAQFVLHAAIEVRISEVAPGEVVERPFHEFLKALHASTSNTYGIGLVAVDGTLLASSGEYPARSRIDDRAYVEAISAGDERVVDRISLAQGNVDAMVSATAVVVGDAKAALVTAWPVEPLSDNVSAVADRAGHFASVMQPAGRMLVMSGTGNGPVQRSMPNLRAHLREGSTGFARTTAGPDDGPALLAVGAVSEAPLVVAYGISVSSVRREWVLDNAPYWAITAATGLFGFLLFGMIREAVASRLHRAVAEQRAEAAETLARHRSDLLREMNHRIKNNLLIIAAVIRTEGRTGSPLKPAELTGRIDAIAAVHDMLYQAEDGVTADVGALLDAIATNPAILPSELGVAVKLDLQKGVFLESKVATTLAMIVSEIITNAVKHAFVETIDPKLSIRMARSGTALDVVVGDNGPGKPLQPGRVSGSDLMTALAESAGISLGLEVHDGTIYRLRAEMPSEPDP